MERGHRRPQQHGRRPSTDGPILPVHPRQPLLDELHAGSAVVVGRHVVEHVDLEPPPVDRAGVPGVADGGTAQAPDPGVRPLEPRRCACAAEVQGVGGAENGQQAVGQHLHAGPDPEQLEESQEHVHPHGHQQVPSVAAAPVRGPARGTLFIDHPWHDRVEELGDGESGEEVDEEEEEVCISQADGLLGLPGLGARILQSSEEDESEHVLVVADLPHEELHPGWQADDGRWGQRAAAAGEGIHAAAVPVVCEHPEEPHGVASVQHLIL
mmetsp:Transcript_18815/g.45420  ORF Transcript_18815/g.45420 Transcript_18815/m.45420 type:complete len:268 (-) Transcript_18815:544-1347(-)